MPWFILLCNSMFTLERPCPDLMKQSLFNNNNLGGV